MPSEKSRYSAQRRGPSPPLEIDELREHLPSIGIVRLSELLWIRAQEDDVLRNILMVSVGIKMAGNSLDRAKEAVAYALHFPDYVRYTEGGHGQILDEIKNTLADIFNQGQCEFSLSVAKYAIECAQEVAENFEDDWDWTSSLKNLAEWRKVNDAG